MTSLNNCSNFLTNYLNEKYIKRTNKIENFIKNTKNAH